MKKVKKIIFIVLLLVLMCSATQASINVSKIDIIKQSAKELELSDTQGFLNKKITEINEANKEITIELSLENKYKQDSEIVFVLDDSGSMANRSSGGLTKKGQLVNSVKNIAEYSYDNLNDIKMGLVSFNSSARTIQNLQSDKTTFINSLTNFGRTSATGDTNIYAGLTSGKRLFTSDAKKVLVLVTDGYPSSNANQIKQELINSESQGIEVITILIDVGEQNTTVNSIFGTVDNPTSGKLYNISNTQLSEITDEIKEIFNKVFKGDIKNIIVKDYFPKDITDNFDIVPNQDSNVVNNYLEWQLDKIQSNEIIKTTYKLRLKDTAKKEIIGKILETNENVKITFNNINEPLEMEDSPSIKIDGVYTENTNNPNGQNSNEKHDKNDDTIKTGKIPQTGTNIIIITITTALPIIFGVYCYVRYKNIIDSKIKK